ncbi:MAG: UTP--glucose-1-phosphate uridylyltransferase [Tepidisphaerales bacterium]
MATAIPDLQQIREQLRAIGQEHVLKFWPQLSETGRAKLLGQLAEQNLPLLARLAEDYVRNKPKVELPAQILPPKVYPRVPTGDLTELYGRARARGMELLMAGKVGAFLVAGGQGTRLGYDGPKGEYPVTPIKNKPLFQVFAEQLLFWGRTTGRIVPWYIMTSELNDAATRAFFEKHGYFGYPKQDVVFFQQGMVPAFAFDGKLLLEAKDSLALAADGHGGSLTALRRSGALDDLSRRGIVHLSYFQVDNPLVYCIDPLFLGLHDLTGSEMSSKTVTKAHALEKVGNFCVADGKLQVIEYSDLPESLAKKTNADGSLVFNYGSIAIHALRVSFIDRLTKSGSVSLPWHRAEKKVACIDDAGNPVRPEKPNAVKLEQFVFDAIPLAENPMVFETLREEEFSPVKNAEGADSPHTSRRDQSARHRRWLQAAGVAVDADATVEISPLYAPTQETFLERGAPAVAGKSIYIG